MKTVRVSRSGALTGDLQVPGDKSISHRALILASQASGSSSITGLSHGEDVQNTARALGQLGVSTSSWGENPFLVTGVGLGGWTEPDQVLDFGNSGTGMRLMAGLLAAHPFFSVLSGDRYLRRRPMLRVVDPLRLMGADISGRHNGELAPLAVNGRKLSGISYSTPVPSAQIKSSVLLAGLLSEGETEVTEPALTRDHTERMLTYLGVSVTTGKGLSVRLEGGQPWSGCDLSVPGDPSAAAFPLAAALVTPGSEVTVRNVCVNPTRTGFFDIAGAMGGDFEFSNQREQCGEPVSDITARASRLRGIDIDPAMVPRAIDEFPVLSALALFAEGTTRITGAAELRVKESDRIGTMALELSRLGGTIREYPDGLEISGGSPLTAATCESHGDHRVAMALAVTGGVLSGDTVIRDTGCIDTSFPGFWELMNNLGARSVAEEKNTPPAGHEEQHP